MQAIDSINMANKGCIKVGADADLAIFEAATVRDNCLAGSG